MARVLITTSPRDYEALVVTCALRRLGHECRLVYLTDYPERERHSVMLGGPTRIVLDGELGASTDWDFDVCWLRDFYPPGYDLSGVHPDDREFVLRSHRQFHHSFWSLVTDLSLPRTPRFWVNPLDAARRGESKPLQLHLAGECGFSLPKTLISNDPNRIREFVRAVPGPVVRKSLVPFEWIEDNKFISNKTTIVTENTLPSDRVLAIHPEIYQAAVEKRFEVRVVFFGDDYFALQIDPGIDKIQTTMDWRIYHHPGIAEHRRIPLPNDIARKCRAIMLRIGLVSASFDFAVQANGDFYFLELNQGGLFLWMENSGIPVLQSFIDFLVRKDSNQFTASGQTSALTVAEVTSMKEYECLLVLDQAHPDVPPPLGPTCGSNKGVC